jgi:hypothetical protein
MYVDSKGLDMGCLCLVPILFADADLEERAFFDADFAEDAVRKLKSEKVQIRIQNCLRRGGGAAFGGNPKH